VKKQELVLDRFDVTKLDPIFNERVVDVAVVAPEAVASKVEVVAQESASKCRPPLELRVEEVNSGIPCCLG
jgi:hypothetical protein